MECFNQEPATPNSRAILTDLFCSKEKISPAAKASPLPTWSMMSVISCLRLTMNDWRLCRQAAQPL
jgi:hypothetical protein